MDNMHSGPPFDDRQPPASEVPSEEVFSTPPGIGAPSEEAVITVPVAHYFALLVGGGLTLLGILGFIPAFTRGSALFGVVLVTTTANVLHLITGVAGLVVWRMNRRRYATAYALAIGTVYFLYFTMGNIGFGNLEGTGALNTPRLQLQWILYNGLHAALMLLGWLVGALAVMQRGDRATRTYRGGQRWTWQSRTRLPSSSPPSS